jgi:hypothetical protein
MARKHLVRDGECLSSIAFQYGFFPDTVWNDGGNSALRNLRKDPNVLLPGDVVHIPDKRIKTESRPTGKTHRFQRKGVPARLKLQLMKDDEPRVNEPFVLTVDGTEHSGKTGPEGEVDVWISPTARKGRLTVGAGDDLEVFELELGHLDPPETIQGVQARLTNLGFPCAGEDGTVGPATKIAISQFQSRHGLQVTGEIDDQLRSRLTELHDLR